MAACLINFTGTSGKVRLDYKVASVPKSIETGIGSLYLEDTVTDVTYTTLEGDVIASSGCLTITALPYICYKLYWKDIRSSGYAADAIVLGSTTITFTDTNFPDTFEDLANNINALHDTRIRITKYLIENTTPPLSESTPASTAYSYIIQVLGSSIPQLRVKNADNTGYIYVHGTASTCSPVGYIDASEICVSL